MPSSRSNGFDATRRKLGVTGQAVHQSVDNANDVTVTHDFKTADKAKAFAASPDLKATIVRIDYESNNEAAFSATT
jgi:hypothetical protein